MRRLKHGEFQQMAPEQQKEWKRMLYRRYRENHRKELRQLNHKYWIKYKQERPAECVCVNCGRLFYAPRNYYKTCENCLLALKTATQQRKEEIAKKRKARNDFIKKILRLEKQNLTQAQIAKKVGYTQCAISYIMRKNGINRKKEILDKANKKRNNKLQRK